MLLADMVITAVGYFIAYLLRFNFDFGQITLWQVIIQLMCIILPLYLIAYICSGSYRGIIRHSSFEDAIRFFFND